MTVKKKLNSNFVRWNKTQLKSSSSIVVDVGKKSTWWVAFLPLKPQLAQHLQDVISLLFHSLSMGNISKITTEFSGLSVWITSLSLSESILLNCTLRKKDRRLERAKSKNWSSSTWRKNPVRRLLSDSRPLQLRRYLLRCEDWQNYIAYFVYECTLELSTLANNA